MHGRPFIQWLLFSLVWLLLLFPLYLITRSGVQQQPEQASTEETVLTWISLTCSSEPQYIKLLQDDRILWAVEKPGQHEFNHPLQMMVDDYGMDFRLQAAFASDLTALEVSMLPDGRDPASVTLWTEQGSMDESVEFTWESAHD